MTAHRQLLAEYANSGSEEAFCEIVSAYLGMVHGCALRLVNGNSQLAEDVAQTVFTDLARHAKTLSPEVIVGGWLHRRTCYAAATAMRSERRRLIRERESVEMNSLNTGEEALAGVAPILDEAINELNEEDRGAIMLRFFDRWSHRAVGEALGTTEAATQKRIERALEKLRVLLARRGVVLTAAALALAVGGASATAAPAGLAAAISAGALANASIGAGATFTTLKLMIMTKAKMIVIAGAVALLAVGTTTTVLLTREPAYTPPFNPNPQKILQEAQADTAAGRYPAALGKFVWFRANALRYDKSMSGVRDSFALTWWGELALKYPPAMSKLTAVYDDAVRTIHRSGNGGRSSITPFLVASSINLGLKRDADTVELFKWLDGHNPAGARAVYSVVEGNLIKAGEYSVCGRYVDGRASYQRILGQYQLEKKIPKSSRNAQLDQFADQSFSHQSAQLVAVLAINHRQDEANDVARQAEKENSTPEFAKLLADAENGTMPPQWP